MKRTILFVDDEVNILSALRREMHEWAEQTDTKLFFAVSAAEALVLLENKIPGLTLVVSDYRMPGLNGLDLLERVRERWPGTATILLSGFTDDEKTQDAMQANSDGFLRKPWDEAELKNAIEVAFAQVAPNTGVKK